LKQIRLHCASVQLTV